MGGLCAKEGVCTEGGTCIVGESMYWRRGVYTERVGWKGLCTEGGQSIIRRGV